jgi:hypothetical protein
MRGQPLDERVMQCSLTFGQQRIFCGAVAEEFVSKKKKRNKTNGKGKKERKKIKKI